MHLRTAATPRIESEGPEESGIGDGSHGIVRDLTVQKLLRLPEQSVKLKLLRIDSASLLIN